MVVTIKSAFALPNLSISRTATPVLSHESSASSVSPSIEQPPFNNGRSLSRPPSPEPAVKHGIAAGFRRSISGRGHTRNTSETDPTAGSLQGNGSDGHRPARARSVAPLLGRLSGTSSFHTGASTPSTTSKATSPSSTPALAQGSQTPVLPQTLEASYVSKSSLRLGELVNRIFAGTVPGAVAAAPAMGAPAAHGDALVVYNGRAAPRVALAKEMGKVIAEQLLSSVSDPYLLRTILRSSILRAVSVFHSRLEQALVAPLTDAQAVAIPRSIKDVDAAPACQKYNLEILKAVWEVRRGIDRACHGFNPTTGEASGEMPHFVLEALKPWREKLTVVLKRIVCPLLDEAKKVVCGKVKEAVRIGAEQSTTLAHGYQAGLTTKTAGIKTPAVVAPQPTATQPAAARAAAAAVIASAPASSSSYRELAGILEGLRRMIDKLDCGQDADRWVIAIATSLVWKGMLAYSIRQGGCKDVLRSDIANRARTPSPPHGRMNHPSMATPRSKSLFRRTDNSGKRSPSPPPGHSGPFAVAQAQLDFRLLEEVEAFESMVRRFVGTLSKQVVVAPSSPPSFNCPLGPTCDLCKTGRGAGLREDDDDDDTEPEDDVALAQEAMVEALQALSATIVVLRASNRPNLIAQTMGAAVPLTPSAAFGALPPPMNGHVSSAEKPAGSLKCPTLARAITTMPTIILLHIVTARTEGVGLPHVMMDMDWPTYEASLRGFAAAEEMSEDVAWEIARVVGHAPLGEWKTVLELVLKVKADLSVDMEDEQH